MWNKKLTAVMLIGFSIWSLDVRAISLAAGGELPQYFNFDGELSETGGGSGTYTMLVQIRNPSGTCLLFESLHTVNVGSDGAFSIKVGDVSRSPNDPGIAWKNIFQNNNMIRASNPTNCPSGYTPAGFDTRALRVIVEGTTLTPDFVLGAVPMATVAETLQGKTAADFVQNSGASSIDAAQVKFHNGAYSVGFKAPSLFDNLLFSWPQNYGTSGQVLTSDGTGNLSWSTPSGGGGGGITSLNGDSAPAQSFAVAATGLDVAWDSTGGVHTLRVPNASDAGVARGVISNSDYTNFNNKLSRSSNLSDLTDVAAARTNLGLGPMAIELPSSYLRTDGITPMNGDLNMNFLRIVNVPMPVSPGHAANKDYVDMALTNMMLTPQNAGTANNPTFTFNTSPGTGMFSPASNIVAFSTTGMQRMQIDQMGRIGIGTGSPGAQLDVTVNEAGAGGIMVRNQNSSGMAEARVSFMMGASTGSVGMTATSYAPNGVLGSETTYLQGQTGGVAIASTFGGAVRFGVGPSSSPIERMRITPSGNVGIGTTTPVATLDIAGTMRMAKHSYQPETCSPTIEGTMALNSSYKLCVCNGSQWVYANDGMTGCSW